VSLLLACALCSVAPVLAQYSRLVGVDGQSPFSDAFVRDCRAAEDAALKTKSSEPLLRLLDKYKKPEELAELELTLGLALSARPGLTNPAQAVVHLTRALKYELPEATRQQALNFRADNLSRDGRYDEALRDRLRVLFAASYRTLFPGCLDIKGPALPLNPRSSAPEDERRRKDYQEYRAHVQLQQDVLVSRYAAIEGANDLKKRLSLSDEKIRVVLNEVSPDASRHDIIVGWLNSENPWPCPKEPRARLSRNGKLAEVGRNYRYSAMGSGTPEQGRNVFQTTLSDGIQRLTIVDHGSSLRVVLMGESVPEFRGGVAKPVPVTQVWLLQKDGSSVPQRTGLHAGGPVFMGGWATTSADISFAHVPVGNLSGVVVAVGNKLLVREIR